MVSVIPAPKEVRLVKEKVKLNASVLKNGNFKNARDTFCEFAARILGVVVTEEENGTIEWRVEPSYAEEEYKICLGKDKILLYASKEIGAHNAAMTLLQLLSVRNGALIYPIGEICDKPDKPWRGFMLDLARVWHPKEMLKQYIDMCRFYKIRYFHLHFNDDQSYTLPSEIYPLLPTCGQNYSREDISEISAYAKKRGVELVPELDVPGHCSAFQNFYPEIFGNNGILCLGKISLSAIESVFGEFCEMFPDAEYIHVGADEANIMLWTECEECKKTLAEVAPEVLHKDKEEQAGYLYAYFVQRICALVKRYGKKPIIWEGVAEKYNDMIPKDVLVMSWENFYQTTPQLTSAGFNVINCSWKPLYVVKSKRFWSVKNVYDWNVCEWEAVHGESPYYRKTYTENRSQQIMGAQLLAWGDGIWVNKEPVQEGIAQEKLLVEKRIPALAENTWNVKKVSDWNEFSSRANKVSVRYRQLEY